MNGNTWMWPGVSDDTLVSAKVRGKMAPADKVKLDAIAAGAQVNVLEGVTGTAPIVAGAIAAKSQAISITAATTGAAGSMSAADKTKLDALTVTGSTDANGWRIDYEATGKRVWRQRWLAVSLPGASDAAVVSASLPVGVSTQADVHLDSVTCRLSGNAGRVRVNVEGAEATTTLTLIAATTDATALDTKASAIDIFVTLAER